MIVTLDKALTCLQHRVANGEQLEEACYKVAVTCRTSYTELLAAYREAGPTDLPKTRLVAGYGWPVCPTYLH